MNTTVRMRDVARRLLERTKLRQVNWIPHNTDDLGCVLYLDKSYMSLSLVKPKAQSDTIKLDLYSLDGENRAIASVSFEGYVFTDGSSSDEYDDDQQLNDSLLLTELYSEATKVAYKWDEILEDINKALSQPGKIGLAEPAKKPSALLQVLTGRSAHAPRR